MMDIGTLFPMVSIVLAAITCYLGYLQYKTRRLAARGDTVRIHSRLTAYPNRDTVVSQLAEIVNRASSGDTVFGHCRTCTGYPESFFVSMPRAIKRGVNFQFIVYDRPESARFIDYLLGLDPSLVEIRTPSVQVYLSAFGIRGKETLICLYFEDRQPGLHFYDNLFTQYIERVFDSLWRESIPLDRKRSN